MKQCGNTLLHPLGSRIFTMDDWIVRIEQTDGTIRLVGCPPALDEEQALQRGILHTLLRPSQIKQVDIARRREHIKEQIAT